MLQKVSVQNFKSLKDVTLELQKVNLFIGPNNSGKSNFLKALELWGKYISFQSEQNRFVKTTNDLKEFSFKKKKGDLKFEVKFNEELIGCHINSSGDGYSDIDYKMLYDGEIYPASNTSTNLLNQVKSSIFNESARKAIRSLGRDIFEDIKIYKINPQSFTNAQPISGVPNSLLLEDGSNMVAFLDFLSGEYKKIFENLQKDLSKCLPEFTDIYLKTVASPQNDQRTYRKWGLGIDDDDKYWSYDLSEGVLYFLALLCIVHQPNPPKLLLLEEPEKGIHPRRIKEVIDFIFQLAEDKDIQVIMTTHSERVLDEFEDIPEAVFVFDKDEEGATQVKNLLKDIIEPSNKLMEENNAPKIKFTDSLGSHWVTGFIGGVPK